MMTHICRNITHSHTHGFKAHFAHVHDNLQITLIVCFHLPNEQVYMNTTKLTIGEARLSSFCSHLMGFNKLIWNV